MTMPWGRGGPTWCLDPTKPTLAQPWRHPRESGLALEFAAGLGGAGEGGWGAPGAEAGLTGLGSACWQ